MGCLLVGSTHRRPVLPSPAPPCRPAARRPDLTGPWCVRVLGSTSLIIVKIHYSQFLKIMLQRSAENRHALALGNALLFCCIDFPGHDLHEKG